MASAEAALDLWRLARWTSPRESLRRLVLVDQSFASLAGALATSEAGRAFLERWKTLMAQHGHRARGEVDLAAPRWSETPDVVLRRLRHYLDSAGQLDLLQVLDQRTRDREQRLAECRARLKNPLRRWAFGFLVRQAQAGIVYRENFKNELLRVVAYLRRLLLDLGERLTRAGKLETREDVFFLTLEEIEPVRTGVGRFDARSVIRTRREEFQKNQAITPPPIVVGEFDPARHTPPPADPNATVLRGLPVSPGVVTGRARVILSADTKEKVLPGEILVAPYTDPGWTPLFLTAAGLVVDLGGQLSHGSVVAREYGLPAVVNVQYATQVIRTGQLVCVDGNQGVVTLLT
jgi:pyruvate,water dikinase